MIDNTCGEILQTFLFLTIAGRQDHQNNLVRLLTDGTFVEGEETKQT
jgi:hypothetical protein